MSPAAYLNWGAWVAHCPNPECYGATELPPGAPGAVCLCRDDTVCDHGPICAAIIRVEWPPELAEIIALTEPRPRRNRNWFPGESLAELAADNRQHGIGVS